MNYIKTSILSFVLLLFVSNVFSQQKSVLCLKAKAEIINANYKELITNEKGGINKSENEMKALQNIAADSLIEWSKKYDLTNESGFKNFCKFSADKMKVATGKKIQLTFVYSAKSQETFNVIALGNGKYNINKAQELKK